MTLLKKKPVQLVLVLLLAAGIVLVGTFAWSSFNQSKINVFTELIAPDVNLHDDFEGGPNKDVYVENSGQSNIFLRVRLTEFLQTTVKGSLVEGHVRDDDKAHNWAPHNATLKTVKGTIDSCTLIDPNKPSAAWGADANFHDYYTWLMGGNTENPTAQIYYLPATTEQKGEYLPDGTVVREPTVVSDPLTGTSVVGDASLDYKEAVNAAIAADIGVAGGTGENDYPDLDPEAEDAAAQLAAAKKARAMEKLGVKETLPGNPIITMSQWIVDEAAPPATRAEETTPPLRKAYAKGDFWVIDEADGWCYWANPLPGGKATSLLLDKVNRTKKTFDSNAEYAINAMLQATDENDLGKFETAEAGTITANGKKLLYLAADKIVIGTDGAEYTKNGDGTYTKSKLPSGEPLPTPEAPFIPLGEDDVNATGANKLAVGTRVTLVDELVWDGEIYENYAAQAAKGAPMYNLTVTASQTDKDDTKQVYEVTGAQRGSDGKVYLKLVAVVQQDTAYVPGGELKYMASVKEETADTVKTYTNEYPGTAPYGEVYAGADGAVGTGDDTRLNPSVTLENRYFHHIGNGVYLGTDKGGTTSNETPVKYYFAGEILTQTKVTSAAGDDINAKLKTLFPTQLAVGEKFNVVFTPDDNDDKTPIPVTAYTPAADGAYTMQELVKGVDKNYYIYLGSEKLGYIGVGEDKFLGNFGTGKADARRWAGPMGIGTPQDPLMAPGDFTETFLKGKLLEDMEPGGTFTADGIEWIVAHIDGYGNRLIVKKPPSGTSAGMTNGVYQGSNTQRDYNNFFNGSLPVLKQYAQPTNGLPMNGLTTVGNVAATAFPLSDADYTAYTTALKTGGLNLGAGTADMRLRSNGTAAGTLAVVDKVSGTLKDAAKNAAATDYPALIVRFSDAKSYVNPNSDFLPIGFNNRVGETFKADGYNWVVLTKDAQGNSLVMTMETVSGMGARMSSNVTTPAYENTLWPARAKTFTGTLTTLKPYALAATLPTEPVYANLLPWNSVPVGQGLSTCTGSAANAVAFPLSAGEYRDYIFTKPSMSSYMYGDYAWGLRSRYPFFSTAVKGGAPYDGQANSAYIPKMAMWVKLP